MPHVFSIALDDDDQCECANTDCESCLTPDVLCVYTLDGYICFDCYDRFN